MKFSQGSEVLISVRLMTYNHQAFIEEALEGIDKQQTDFDFEVVVGDDFSTDDTKTKIQEFEFYNPRLSLNILERENGNRYYRMRKKKGRLYNFLDILYNCKGKYIALLDGDDFWTDPLKLQKQVDFLEKNQDYGICFHNVNQVNYIDETSLIIPNVKVNTVYDMEVYIKNNLTATCSIVFKKEFLGSIPQWFLELPFGDLGLILIVMQNSNKKGFVMKDIMGVYRIHEKGIHGSLHKDNWALIEAYKQHLVFNNIIASRFLVQREFRSSLIEKKIMTYEKLANLYREIGKRSTSLKFLILKEFYQFKKKTQKHFQNF